MNLLDRIIGDRFWARGLAWWRVLLAALASALVGLLGAGTASGTSVPELGTRVVASSPARAFAVGVKGPVTAGQRWGNGATQAGRVIGCWVAPEGAVGAIAGELTHYDGAIQSYDRSLDVASPNNGPAPTRGPPACFVAALGNTSFSCSSESVAAKTGDDLVDVWRVVGPDEAAQIGKTRSYQVQLGGEGKYFFPTREQAENLGQMYTKQGWGGQQTLTRGQAPRSVIDRAEPVNAGTEGPGWFVRSPDIPSICNVTCVGPVG